MVWDTLHPARLLKTAFHFGLLMSPLLWTRQPDLGLVVAGCTAPRDAIQVLIPIIVSRAPVIHLVK
jgi:hypothetical protein